MDGDSSFGDLPPPPYLSPPTLLSYPSPAFTYGNGVSPAHSSSSNALPSHPLPGRPPRGGSSLHKTGAKTGPLQLPYTGPISCVALEQEGPS
ncbi:hypothetical protein E2C01_049051 [Portunus trituberculatus]|uniref:Uncharacterized protein n=1 Tax=Portunus trituberculatus TaxID=210409 RepID=A0A5B7G4M5_PORTR|nr:hypothetical protein [Portunus trituberculatus]